MATKAYDLDRYDRRKEESSSKNNDGEMNHDVVTLHGQWGKFQFCRKCNLRATEEEMKRENCDPKTNRS